MMSRLRSLWSITLAIVLLVGNLFSASAQDVPLPLLWKGEGKGLLVLPEQVESMPFKIELHVDEDGSVSGHAYMDRERGEGVVEKLYYTETSEGVRHLVLVIVAHEEENPNMFILRGKMIDGRLAFGEVLTKAFEKDGEIERGLRLDSKTAVQIYESYMPTSLRDAIDGCKLIGSYHIIGSYATP